jgi:hypothetical protein
MYDSARNDRFDAAPNYGLMQSGGSYYNYAQGFDVCRGYATAGLDSAYFYDSKGDDRFVSSPNNGTMTDSRGTYLNVGVGFDNIYGYSKNGGNDSAILYDSAGNDIFTGNSRASQMRGAKNEYSNYAEGFKNLEARAENGGNDLALINDVAANDKLFGNGKELTVTRSTGRSWLQGFAKITATAANRTTASGRWK